MKKSIFIPVSIMLLILITSCVDKTNMLTVIKPDGSCYREFDSKVGANFLTAIPSKRNNPFPVEIDSTDQISWQYKNSPILIAKHLPMSRHELDSIIYSIYPKDTVRIDSGKLKTKVLIRLRKIYPSVNSMAKQFKWKKDFDWSPIKIKYSLDKSFKWFYTYYTYKETYPKIVTNFKIPISKYLSKDEAMYWFTGHPDLLKGLNGIEAREDVGGIEDKYNLWLAKNLWKNEFDALCDNYHLIKKQPVTLEKLKSLEDTIFMSKVKSEKDFKMEKILDEYFKTKVFSKFWKMHKSPMKVYESNLDNEGFMKYFHKAINYKLLMPGKVVSANNFDAKGDTLEWKLTAYRMVPADYVIQAQSRKINIWAFIITGLIVVVAVGSFFWKPKR